MEAIIQIQSDVDIYATIPPPNILVNINASG